MASQQTDAAQYAVLALVVGALALVGLRLNHPEVRFCRAAFTKLAAGHPAVSRQIAWDRLQAIGVDVGATYTKLPNDQERRAYQAAFIEQFSAAFKQAGGTPKAFVGWRLADAGDEQMVVAADYPATHKTLLVSIPRSGHRQIEGLQWQ